MNTPFHPSLQKKASHVKEKWSLTTALILETKSRKAGRQYEPLTLAWAQSKKKRLKHSYESPTIKKRNNEATV